MVRPGRLPGFDGGSAGGNGPEGYWGGWEASCTGNGGVAEGLSRTPTGAGTKGCVGT